MEKLTYTLVEAAQVLGISKSYAYELAKRNELPIVRIGSRIVVPIKRLEEWLEEQTVKTAVGGL